MHEKWLGEITENIGKAFIIDDSGVRKERSGNTVDAFAERSSCRRVMDVVLFTLFLMGFLNENRKSKRTCDCLLYTSDAADE